MFGKKKTNDINELEKEFNVAQFKLGGIDYQMEVLAKTRNKLVQEMDALSKRGVTVKNKIAQEIEKQVAKGQSPEQPVGEQNEVN